MRTSRQFVFFIVFIGMIFIQIGCATKGFNRGELNKQMGVIKPNYDDKEIKKAFGKKPNLPRPFKLGIYFKTPNAADKNWRWTEQDKNLIEEITKELKSKKLISDAFPILNSLVPDNDLKTIRLIAAKHQADAVMVISGAGEIDRYSNNLALTYIVILPTFFVHGSEADTLFISNAALWDVKNEYLYLTAESEGIVKDPHAAAFGKSDKELLEEAKAKSLNDLKQEIIKMLKGSKI